MVNSNQPPKLDVALKTIGFMIGWLVSISLSYRIVEDVIMRLIVSISLIGLIMSIDSMSQGFDSFIGTLDDGRWRLRHEDFYLNSLVYTISWFFASVILRIMIQDRFTYWHIVLSFTAVISSIIHYLVKRYYFRDQPTIDEDPYWYSKRY